MNRAIFAIVLLRIHALAGFALCAAQPSALVLDGVLADRLHDVAHGARAEFVRIGDSNVPCLCPRLSTGNRREERFQLCNSQTSAPSELLRRPLPMTGRAAHVALRDLSKDDRPRPA